ncbi:MAG: transposase [Pseudomonadales bacterium]
MRAPSRQKSGGQFVYSDHAINAGLTVRLVYGLALRQTEGFLLSVSTLLDLDLRIPDNTTLSRRSKDLDVRIPVSANDGSLHIIIDSTGLRVHSGNVPGSKPPRRRAWRKLHKKPSEYFLENFYITTSGMNYENPLLLAHKVMGPDRILFAVVYPAEQAKEPVRVTDGAPISDEDKQKIYRLNAEKLFRL